MALVGLLTSFAITSPLSSASAGSDEVITSEAPPCTSRGVSQVFGRTVLRKTIIKGTVFRYAYKGDSTILRRDNTSCRSVSLIVGYKGASYYDAAKITVVREGRVPYSFMVAPGTIHQKVTVPVSPGKLFVAKVARADFWGDVFVNGGADCSTATGKLLR